MIGPEMSGLIMPERLRPAHNAGMERFAETGKAKVMGRRIEIDALRRDGTEFPIELSITSTGTGAKAHYVAFMRDITDRRMAEQSLKKAKEDAEDASRAKAQFLAAISHEMRTPLTGILGALDLIAATDLSEQQRKYVRTANRSGHALLSVISDVLDISRLEDGQVDLDVGITRSRPDRGRCRRDHRHPREERGNTIEVSSRRTACRRKLHRGRSTNPPGAAQLRDQRREVHLWRSRQDFRRADRPGRETARASRSPSATPAPASPRATGKSCSRISHS